MVKRDRMGGECLNTGCMPSKALLAAVLRAGAMRDGTMGVPLAGTKVNLADVRAHVQGAIAAIVPLDSVERSTAWAVEVAHGDGCFTGRTVRVRLAD